MSCFYLYIPSDIRKLAMEALLQCSESTYQRKNAHLPLCWDTDRAYIEYSSHLHCKCNEFVAKYLYIFCTNECNKMASFSIIAYNQFSYRLTLDPRTTHQDILRNGTRSYHVGSLCTSQFLLRTLKRVRYIHLFKEERRRTVGNNLHLIHFKFTHYFSSFMLKSS